MKLTTIELDSINQFAQAYMTNDPSAKAFFRYDWLNKQHDEERASYLATRKYNRAALADYITNYMGPLGLSDQIQGNINALRQDALVVIAGQQAGLLTGPMYSINKIISVIKIAEEKAKQLSVPVVPVFWIAGEDHDFPEVNHVYLKTDETLVKKTYPTKPRTKEMVSDTILEVEVAKQWVDEVIQTLGETSFTKSLEKELTEAIEQSSTVTQFFAALIHQLFAETGLLLVDSGDPQFRKLGADAYAEFADKSRQISEAVLTVQKELNAIGFPRTLETDLANANLFYYHPEEKNRTLLERDEISGQLQGKGEKLVFPQAEINAILRNTPEWLSTNVVTRPILQEKLFPVLAFVGGPGEIAYWAELGTAFQIAGEEMPPIFPRMSITILERNVVSKLDELMLPLDAVLKHGCLETRDRHVRDLMDPELGDLFQQMVSEFESKHHAWMIKATADYQNLDELYQRNHELIMKQMNFMQQKLLMQHERTHGDLRRKYDLVENSLHPNGGPQDRTLNVYYFLNRYGKEWLSELLTMEMDLTKSHIAFWL